MMSTIINNKPILLLVVPCYNEEEVLLETTKRLSSLLQKMMEENTISSKSKILYVNDGSHDETWNIIYNLYKTNPFVCGINLAKNVGHQNALMAGLLKAKDLGEAIISIDADLQDDINVIPLMIRDYINGYDIVYGVRNKRKTDTWFKRNSALFFYKLMIFLGVNSIYNHADFRLMSKRAVVELSKYKERNLFLRGIVPLIGYKTSSVFYDRSAREAGVSKYPLKKMINFALDGITSFSIKPVRMLLYVGIIFIIISAFILLWAIIKLAQGEVVQGWTSIIISIWFVGGVLLMGLGIIGEYIGKMYIEVKSRPRYNIETELIK